MVETVRQFARDQLRFTGSDTAVRTAHSKWAAHTVDNTWLRAIGPGQDELQRLLAEEADNLDVALDWATSHDLDTAAPIFDSLGWHRFLSGHLSVAASVIQRSLMAPEPQPSLVLRTSLLAQCLAYSEDVDGALEQARLAYDGITGELSTPQQAWILSTLQLCYFMSVTVDPSLMVELADRSTELLSRTNDRFASIRLHEVIASAYSWNGRTSDGLRHQVAALELATATGDGATIDRVYGNAIYNFMLDRDLRRFEPKRIVEQWAASTVPNSREGSTSATDWLPWVYMQSGDLDSALDALARLGDRRQEGYNRTIYHIVRASISWMRGDIRAATTDISTLQEHSISERWWHVFYPLAAEIAADAGDINRVRSLADGYLELPVHSTGEAAKLGVLMPLVRAEVDAELNAESSQAANSAHRTFAKMTRILLDHPPLTAASTSILTHNQNLLLAEAELSRLSTSDPELWTQAGEAADYAHYRIYAGWRASEALIASHRTMEASHHLRRAYAEAVRGRADLLRIRIIRTARSAGIDLLD